MSDSVEKELTLPLSGVVSLSVELVVCGALHPIRMHDTHNPSARSISCARVFWVVNNVDVLHRTAMKVEYTDSQCFFSS